MNGTGYCGDKATCSNTAGSFTCTCLPNWTAHTPWTSCRDLNECTEGGSLCKVGDS